MFHEPDHRIESCTTSCTLVNFAKTIQFVIINELFACVVNGCQLQVVLILPVASLQQMPSWAEGCRAQADDDQDSFPIPTTPTRELTYTRANTRIHTHTYRDIRSPLRRRDAIARATGLAGSAAAQLPPGARLLPPRHHPYQLSHWRPRSSERQQTHTVTI